MQNTNLTSAFLAKKLGAKKTIARVGNYEFLLRENLIPMQRLGINNLISPEQLAADEILHLIREGISNEVTFSIIRIDGDDITENDIQKLTKLTQIGKGRYYTIGIYEETYNTIIKEIKSLRE